MPSRTAALLHAAACGYIAMTSSEEASSGGSVSRWRRPETELPPFTGLGESGSGAVSFGLSSSSDSSDAADSSCSDFWGWTGARSSEESTIAALDEVVFFRAEPRRRRPRSMLLVVDLLRPLLAAWAASTAASTPRVVTATAAPAPCCASCRVPPATAPTTSAPTWTRCRNADPSLRAFSPWNAGSALRMVMSDCWFRCAALSLRRFRLHLSLHLVHKHGTLEPTPSSACKAGISTFSFSMTSCQAWSRFARPVRTPSSWLPRFQGERCVNSIPSGTE
mmetsp:Transcript_102072/g.284985  ORF Transcript_102072/g.284985 Transcript_102072/m.284985 type:complete len:278 (+) Transcript_102072:335-1168(+)